MFKLLPKFSKRDVLFSYIREVRTLVHGKINPRGIGYPEGVEMTGATYYLGEGPLNSVNVMVRVPYLLVNYHSS